MKHGTLVLAFLATVAMSWNPVEGAVDVDVTFTGDNVVESFYFGAAGVAPSPVDLTGASNLSDWDAADTISVSVNESEDYSLYFRVTQHPTVGFSYRNPAAFLADISVGDTLLSSTSANWLWASGFDDLGKDITDPANVNASGWAPVTAWAANEGDAKLLVTDTSLKDEWNLQGDDPVQGISDSAQWIWGGDNFNVGQPVSEQWLKTTVSVVPEPSAIAIWSLMALLGLGLATRRRK